MIGGYIPETGKIYTYNIPNLEHRLSTNEHSISKVDKVVARDRYIYDKVNAEIISTLDMMSTKIGVESDRISGIVPYVTQCRDDVGTLTSQMNTLLYNQTNIMAAIGSIRNEIKVLTDTMAQNVGADVGTSYSIQVEEYVDKCVYLGCLLGTRMACISGWSTFISMSGPLRSAFKILPSMVAKGKYRLMRVCDEMYLGIRIDKMGNVFIVPTSSVDAEDLTFIYTDTYFTMRVNDRTYVTDTGTEYTLSKIYGLDIKYDTNVDRVVCSALDSSIVVPLRIYIIGSAVDTIYPTISTMGYVGTYKTLGYSDTLCDEDMGTSRPILSIYHGTYWSFQPQVDGTIYIQCGGGYLSCMEETMMVTVGSTCTAWGMEVWNTKYGITCLLYTMIGGSRYYIDSSYNMVLEPTQFYLLECIPNGIIPNISNSIWDSIFSESYIPCTPTGMEGNTNMDSVIKWNIDILRLPNTWMYSTGKGVHIHMNEYAVDIDHPMIVHRVVSCETGAIGTSSSSDHGTSTVSIVSSIAYNSTISIARVNPSAIATYVGTDRAERLFIRPKAKVYSNAWGPNFITTGVGIQPFTWWKECMNAISTGTQVNGSVYVFAVGNDGNKASTVYVPLTNSIYTIPVASVNKSTYSTTTNNTGYAILVSAPGGNNNIYTSSGTNTLCDIDDDKCNTDTMYDYEGVYSATHKGGTRIDFGKSSAACSHIAGVLALMLDVQPSLTYRDIQSILRMCCRVPITMAMNSTYTYSEKYGFGIPDVGKCVQMAMRWTALPPEQCITYTYTTPTPIVVPESGTLKYTIPIDGNISMENVILSLDITGSRSIDIAVSITCPDGTTANIVRPVSYIGNKTTSERYTLYVPIRCLAFWGKRSIGVWNITIGDANVGYTHHLNGYRINIYGS